MALTRADFDAEPEYLAYCAARECWPKRDELTPSSLKPKAEWRGTWSQWYERRFGRPLEEAVREYRERQG